MCRTAQHAFALTLAALVLVTWSVMPTFAQAGAAVAVTNGITEDGPAVADAGYRLGTGDRLQITVYGEPDLSGVYDVDGSGYVRMPLVGQIKVAGMTLVQMEDKVQSTLAAGYLKEPKVSAEVVNYRPFYIIGEVNKPGEYPYASGMNVLTAVALAGGYTYRADDSDVYIRRKGSRKEISAPADQMTKVEPGDIVRVAERFF
ncbi:MAG: polysaccharide export protein [Alphaproteobacteria bacterium]|nr:polysaccharide export protein [Alphaproteobacteria bacterium]